MVELILGTVENCASVIDITVMLEDVMLKAVQNVSGTFVPVDIPSTCRDRIPDRKSTLSLNNSPTYVYKLGVENHIY